MNGSPYAQFHVAPPPPFPTAPADEARVRRKTRLLAWGIVLPLVTVMTLIGLWLVARRGLFPPQNIVYVDNATAETVEVSLNGKTFSLGPHGSKKALRSIDLDN